MNIPFNNSSLEDMVCSRRYVYRVVRGAIVPPSPELSNGKLFHHYMQHITDADIPIFMTGPMVAPKWNTPEIEAIAKDIPEAMRLALAVLAGAVRDKLGDKFNTGVREGFFRFPFPEDANLPGLDICGTVDLELFDEDKEYVVLSDYKTTKSKLTADLIMSYRLKSQLFFYAISKVLQYVNNPPPEDPVKRRIYDAIKAGRIMRRYILVSYYDMSDVDRCICIDEALPIHQDMFDEFYRFMRERASYAKFLHSLPEISVKEGMSNNGCFFCPFKAICSLHDPLAEKQAFERWRYGFAPYNPETF